MPNYYGSVNFPTTSRDRNIIISINRILSIPTYLSDGALFVDHLLNVFNAGRLFYSPIEKVETQGDRCVLLKKMMMRIMILFNWA
jgi:hypothetical protein